jgi:hypothetical protein
MESQDLDKIVFDEDSKREEKIERMNRLLKIGDLVILHFEGKERYEGPNWFDIKHNAVGYFHGIVDDTYPQIVLGTLSNFASPRFPIHQEKHNFTYLREVYCLANIEPNPASDVLKKDVEESLSKENSYLYLKNKI